jgi:hypothetical protein
MPTAELVSAAANVMVGSVISYALAQSSKP